MKNHILNIACDNPRERDILALLVEIHLSEQTKVEYTISKLNVEASTDEEFNEEEE